MKSSQKNLKAVDNTLANLFEVPLTGKVNGAGGFLPAMTPDAPQFVREVLGELAAGNGDDLPVSAFPLDGTFPTATAQYEKRNLALDIPVWNEAICIQCLKCVAMCPHADDPRQSLRTGRTGRRARHPQIRRRPRAGMEGHAVPSASRGRGLHRMRALRGSLSRPGQDGEQAQGDQHAAPGSVAPAEHDNWNFFLGLPEMDRRKINTAMLRQQQVMQPLFEFSGACAGCGETPYLKLLTQLFGDRALIANATGCSSIYGGNLPTTPYAKNAEGRGPTWCNSLFEDNAEFGLGFRVSLDKQKEMAEELLRKLAGSLGDDLVAPLLQAGQTDEAGIAEQRARVADLEAEDCTAGFSARRGSCSAWRINSSRRASGSSAATAGPTTSATAGWTMCWPAGAMSTCLCWTLRFTPTPAGRCPSPPRAGRSPNSPPAAKPGRKKDLGLIAMAYGQIYVASVAMGAKDEQTLKAFRRGGILSRPVAHHGLQSLHRPRHRAGRRRRRPAAKDGGGLRPVAPLPFRSPPRRARREPAATGLRRRRKRRVREYLLSENRFKMLDLSKPDAAHRFFAEAQTDADRTPEILRVYAKPRSQNGAAPAAAPRSRSPSTRGKTVNVTHSAQYYGPHHHLPRIETAHAAGLRRVALVAES